MVINKKPKPKKINLYLLRLKAKETLPRPKNIIINGPKQQNEAKNPLPIPSPIDFLSIFQPPPKIYFYKLCKGTAI